MYLDVIIRDMTNPKDPTHDAIAVMYVQVPLPGSKDDLNYVALFPYRKIINTNVATIEIVGVDTDVQCGSIID